MVAEVVDEQRMPPWYASVEHGTFQNDRSLDGDARRTIVDWVRSGMAEGEPASDESLSEDSRATAKTFAHATPGPDHWSIGEPDRVLRMLLPHSLPADGFIPYRYVVFPHVFLKDTWIEAFEIRPDNPSVVHHANLAYASRDEKPGRGTFITGYVPGGQAMQLAHFENDVAYRIPALSVLGLQIHYVTTGKPEHCRIELGIRYKRGTVRKQLRHNLADPHRFRIPPHHPAYPVRDDFVIRRDATLLGMFCHMHLRGKDMTFTAYHPDGRAETLLQIPNYNFDWQLGYEIRAGEKRLPAGTRIDVVAHYDNSAFNPYNPDPAKTVRYGPQTVHEMMNGYVFYTYDDDDLNLRIDPKNGRVLEPAGE